LEIIVGIPHDRRRHISTIRRGSQIIDKIKKNTEEIVRSIRKKFNKLMGKSYIREGKCKQCGKCCRMIVLVSEGGIITSEDEFNQLKEVFPEYERFVFKGRDKDGVLRFTCKYLGKDNKCGDYKGRPIICRDYPTEEIFVRGGIMATDCGFVFIPVEDFQKMLDEAMNDDEISDEELDRIVEEEIGKEKDKNL